MRRERTFSRRLGRCRTALGRRPASRVSVRSSRNRGMSRTCPVLRLLDGGTVSEGLVQHPPALDVPHGADREVEVVGQSDDELHGGQDVAVDDLGEVLGGDADGFGYGDLRQFLVQDRLAPEGGGVSAVQFHDLHIHVATLSVMVVA